MANADNVRKLVMRELVDTRSRAFYAYDLMREAVPGGFTDADAIDLPTQAKPTSRSATTRAVPEAISPTANKLFVDQELFYNIDIAKKSDLQLMEGSWLANTSQDAAISMLNDRDDNLLGYLAKEVAWAADARFLVNAGHDAVSADDVSLAEAKMRDQDGAADLVWVTNPYFSGGVKSLADNPVTAVQQDVSRIGIPQVSSLNGIPHFTSRSVPRQISADVTASAISSNELELTVAEGHGFQVGMRVTTSGLSANVTSAAAITAVTATTITVPLTASNAADNGTGTVSCDCAFGLLINRRQIFRAEANDLRIEVVSDYESGKRALQVHHLFGRKGIAGACVAVLSPGNSVA